MSKRETDSVYYVEIGDPQILRRGFLESTREVLQCLKRLKSFRQIEEQKPKELARLRKIMKEIGIQTEKLKSLFPKTHIREDPEPFNAAIAKPKKKSKKSVEKLKKIPEAVRTELELLESELLNIEGKLNNL